MDLDSDQEINQLDELLKMDIIELKTQMEENQLIYGITNKDLSSIYIPKDPDYFRIKRKINLKHLLQGKNEKFGRIVADSIRSEMDSCDTFEYREKSLMFLLNQFFKDQIKRFVNMKHSQMLRYKRYCINKKLTDFIKSEYLERIKAIDDEYLDSKTRHNRLRTSKEGYFCKTDQGFDEMNMDDIIIYLKWVISDLFSLEYITSIVKIISWVPVKYRKKNSLTNDNDTDSNSKSEKSSKHTRSSIEASFFNYQEESVTARFSFRQTPNVSIDVNASVASGGGLAIDEKNLLFPLHTNDIQNIEHLLIYFCSIYSIDMDIKKIRNSADEMELYSMVSRRFKIVFNIQEQMRTFKVYDKIDLNSPERWGMESSSRALLKPANWMAHNTFRPQTTLLESSYLNTLRTENIKDEYLVTAALFVKKSNVEETQNNLRHNALIVQHLPVVYNTSVISNPKGFDIADILKTIYTKSDMNLRTFTSDDNSNRSSDDDQDNYNFTESLQLLGLDDCTEAKDDSSTVQGAYLSYLHLRFLKIRDLQRTCLSILNYFRSVERTLVINANEFTKGIIRSEPKRQQAETCRLDIPITDNLANHTYLQATVEDFKTSEEEFMKSSEIENHDDFYLHEDGRIHVQDLMGNWIMYDISLKDFEKMEEDLILIGSHYVNNDKEMRLSSLFNRKQSQTEHNDGSDFYISEYGHREVDRFGVLYDLWCQHTEFMEKKKKLIDLYMEVYNSIYEEDDRKYISQLIVNMMHRKPRLDIHSKYFLVPYRFENLILTRQFEIFKMILDKQIIKERQHLMSVYKDSNHPFRFIDKLLIAPNSDESALENIYFFEFVPSLAHLCQLNDIINYVCVNIRTTLSNMSVTNILRRELDLLDAITSEILEFQDVSRRSYEPDLVKFLNSDSIICNPLIMQDLAKQYLKNIEGRNTRGEKKTRKAKTINEFCRIFELATLRFRLIQALNESDYLHIVYDNQAMTLGYENFHLYMRHVPFERSNRTEGVENYKPLLYISSVQDDDSVIERYIPINPYPAIYELDRHHFGKYILNTISDVIKCLESKCLENIQLMLKTQICHKNAVAIAVLLCDNCRPSVYNTIKDQDVKSTEGNISQSTSNFNLPISAQSGPTPLALDSSRASMHAMTDSYPEAFFSLQLEKIPIRDKMLNAFLKKYPFPLNLSQPELEKAKRDSISGFVNAFYERITHVALKAQIIAYYNAIIGLLNLVPDIKSEFFQFGKAFNPSQFSMDPNCNSQDDPRVLKRRCRKVIDDEGQKLINIWYIPHFSEILFLHRQTDDAKANPILKSFLRIVMAFHDILHYLIGFWNMSLNSTRVTEKLKTKIFKLNNLPVDENCQNIVHPLHVDQNAEIKFFSDYENSNTYQLRKELIDLEIQLKNLEDANSVEQAIELLNIRRQFHYFYFETCVKVVLVDIFLSTDNMMSYKKLLQGVESAFPVIKNMSYFSYINSGIKIPSMVLSTDDETENLYPWRAMMRKTGAIIITFDSLINLSDYIQLCLVGIPEKFKYLIYNEFYNLNLTLEDVLVEHSKQGKEIFRDNSSEITLLSKKIPKRERKELHQNVSAENPNALQKQDSISKPPIFLSIRRNPIETYRLFLDYLTVLLRLHILKKVFGCRKALVKEINSKDTFITISRLYKTSILFPTLRKLSNDMSTSHLYFYGPTTANDIVTYPQGISEMFINKLLIKALISDIEKYKINLLRCKIIRKIDQVIKQRHYESESVEPDNSNYLILKYAFKRPNLVTDFIEKIEAPFYKTKVKEENAENEENEENVKNEEEESTLTYSKQYINDCLLYLGVTLLRVHRETYENFAMFFENQLKHQQQLINHRNREHSILKELIQEKEQSSSVEKYFILAKKVSKHILEINFLRAKLKEDAINNANRESFLRKQYSLSYKFLVRNLYCLGFEQMTRMKISISRLHSNVFQRINETRISAWNEMNKVKDKSIAKFTTDDELTARNISLSKQLTSTRKENFSLFQFLSRMKSLLNWSYTNTMNDHDKMIYNAMKESLNIKSSVYVTNVDGEQKVKLMKCELKRLNVNIKVTEKELSDLKFTLNKEITQKIQKRQGAKMKNIQLKKSTQQKQRQINKLLRRLLEMNSKITTMNMNFQDYIRNNKTVAFKSHEEVENLSRILADERAMKLKAFTKVDDLMSQVYEFEAAFAIANTQLDAKRGKMTSSKLQSKMSESRSGKPNEVGTYPQPSQPQARLKYQDIVNRYCIPYTPCHVLPYRRNRVEAQRTKIRIKNKLQDELNTTNRTTFLPKIRKQSGILKNQKS